MLRRLLAILARLGRRVRSYATFGTAKPACELLLQIAAQDFTFSVILVLDNVRYQHCAFVQNLAATFGSLEEQNGFLSDWEESVAVMRIHGTTKRQVGKVFVEIEKSALLPLPRERFAMFHEAQRIVSRDGHVEVAKAYYSVLPEYLGLTVWARWDTRLVRVFNQPLRADRHARAA